MRFGLFGFGFFVLVVYLILINSGDIEDQAMADIMVTLEGNLNDSFDSAEQTDTDLSNFMRLTSLGIAKEFHGTYYLSKWLNKFLPYWLVENPNLILVLAILLILSPIISPVFLILMAICLIIWDRIKERRRQND